MSSASASAEAVLKCASASALSIPPNLSLLSRNVNHARIKLAYHEGMEQPGERLRRMRIDRDLKLEQVAEIIGISAQALSQIETGVTKNVRPENFLRLCAFYDVDPYRVIFAAGKGEIAAQLRTRRATRQT